MNSSMKTRECVKVYGTFNPFVGLDPGFQDQVIRYAPDRPPTQ